MKKSSLKVALNMSTLSVPEKIRKATAVVNALTDHADVFVTPAPDLKEISNMIDNLNNAYVAAADGGKSRTRAMYDLADDLMMLMKQLATYIEQVANGDESIVHLTGLEIKALPAFSKPDFSATLTGHGQVTLQVKAHKDTIYKWQYSADNGAAAPVWADILRNKVSKATVQGLAAGLYLFRVIFIDETGEHNGNTLSVAVN